MKRTENRLMKKRLEASPSSSGRMIDSSKRIQEIILMMAEIEMKRAATPKSLGSKSLVSKGVIRIASICENAFPDASLATLETKVEVFVLKTLIV